jgi:hypothetical protein
MSTLDWVRANSKGAKNYEPLVVACMKATGCGRDAAVRAVRTVTGMSAPRGATPGKSHAPRASAATGTPSTGRTLELFRQTFDVPLRIRQGIRRHLVSVYMTDQEFRESCGVPSTNWRRYADDDEFRANRGKFSGQTYWASETMMSKMKRIAGIPQEV